MRGSGDSTDRGGASPWETDGGAAEPEPSAHEIAGLFEDEASQSAGPAAAGSARDYDDGWFIASDFAK